MKHLPDLLILRHRCLLFHSSVRSSICLSVNSSVMSKFDIYIKVSILINYSSTTTIIPCMIHLPDLLTWQVHWPGWPWPVFWAQLTLTQFTLTCQIFSTIRRTTTKPCIMLLLDVLTRQIPWPGDLDLYFALQRLWHILRWRSISQLEGLQSSNLAKCFFSMYWLGRYHDLVTLTYILAGVTLT